MNNFSVFQEQAHILKQNVNHNGSRTHDYRNYGHVTTEVKGVQ